MLVKEMVEKLQKLDPEATIACPLWQVADVLDICREKLTGREAAWALEQADRHHDCQSGITWDTIEYWVMVALSRRGET